MKILAFILTIAFTFNANAGLITTLSNTDTQVTVDFSVANFDSSIFELFADFSFNQNALTFVSYTDSAFVEDTFGLIEPIIDTDVLGQLAATFYFYDSFSEPTFSLGQAVFNIQPNADISEISFIQDNVASDGFDLLFASSSVVVDNVRSVPEPSSFALFAGMAIFLFARKRKVK